MRCTVLTPVLNGGPLFRDCLESVRRERDQGAPIEHLILDGGSTDGSVELARSFGARVISRPDLGLYERLNLGFEQAADGLVTFIGADDFLVESCVARVLEARRRTGRRWVAGATRWIDGNGRHLAVLRPIHAFVTKEQHAAVGHPLIHIQATWIEKSLHRELGGFDTRYRIAAEYDFVTRALAVAPFARLTEVVSVWRLTGDNFSVLNRRDQVAEYRAISLAHGPRSAIARRLWSYGHRIGFNLANPDYVRGKLVSRIKHRLGLGSGARF